MKKKTFPLIMGALVVLLVAVSTLGAGRLRANTSTAEGAAQAFFAKVRAHDADGAYAMVSPSSNIDKGSFYRDLYGSDGNLKTFSNLQQAETRVLRETDAEADVRTNLQWSTAVGAFNEARDIKMVKESGGWHVFWPAPQQVNLPPQVIPVNYLRWDIIHPRSGDEWGSQNVEAPRVRIVSMNAVEKDGNIIIMGEVVNEDTVPGFVNVSATLVGQDGKDLREESSFDKTSHTLLPKEVSPFRIDFVNITLKQIKNVRMSPNALLVPASADPVVGVLHQRIEKDARGHSVLRGELVNESGQTVNIPHVLATYYDNSGKVIWVSDGYVDKALLPQVPVPFSVELRDDVAPNVQTYRVTVNNYTIDRS